MLTLTIGSKGQIVLTPELLRHLNLGPGQKIRVDKLPGNRLLLQAAPKTEHADR